MGNAICNGSPRITYESVVLFSHFLANSNKKFNIFVFYRIRGAPSTLGPAPAGGCGFGRVSRCWRVDSRVHLRFSVALCSFITITEFLNVTYTAHFYCMSSVGYRSKAFYEYNTAIGVNGLDFSVVTTTPYLCRKSTLRAYSGQSQTKKIRYLKPIDRHRSNFCYFRI